MISRPRNIISFLIVSVFLFVVPANAFEGKSTKEVLDNGMTVVVSEIPTSPVVAVYALVKAGSATEGEFLGSGITHYLEHMLFQETTNRGVGEIAAQIQAVGGNINASTGMDSTVYKIEVPFDQFDIGLDIMADMLMNTVFSEEELTKERDVVLSEMQLHNDNPSRRLAELTFKTMYLKHPYGHPTIGYKPLFTAISKEDVEKYYHQYYGPNNIVLAIAGNINADDVLPKIRETFKDFERRPEIMRNLPVEPLQISPRFYEEEYATPIARMSLAYGSVGLLDEDLYPLDVLAKILGDGASSRLYRELYKKKKLVQYISASNYTPMDRGVFWISTVLDYNNMDATIEAISSEIEKIKQKGVLPSELEKARAQVLADHVFGSQTAESVAYSQALDEAYTGDHLFANKYLEGIRRVTNDDVVRVAKKYLKEQSRSVVVLKPKGLSDQKDEVSSAIAVGDMEKYVLDNGLTVLLRVNKRFPLVAVRLSLNGGIRQEAPELNGVSNLTASLWTKGTKKKSADQIAEYTESLGMSLGAFSGKNSFGLSIDFLSEYFDQAMDLFEDVVKNPVFPQDEL
ncbi:MAG: insulinase family protein, partial [Candidatus Omnitrophica bacterium]|nr:insulinase family protein [Candidatus Omnitrophota bacterium]